MANVLSHSDILKLKRWNTPTIYNGWEQITKCDTTKGHFNLRPVTDYMPNMGVMCGYAVTVKCAPSRREYAARGVELTREYRRYVAYAEGPKIVMVEDMDDPHVGSYWGEANANIHRALGCVGTITDGCIRDVDEMNNAGFKAIAGSYCVGHAFSTPIEWNCPVNVFGCAIHPGDFIHADKHGFLVVPADELPRLYEAACFMDANECENLINVSRSAAGKPVEQVLEEIEAGGERFRAAARAKYGSRKVE